MGGTSENPQSEGATVRIRTIKPEFWGHPIMARQSDGVRLMAIGLLNYADDEGYFLADPILVRNALWPFDESSSKVRGLLDDLSKLGYIELSESAAHGVIGRIVNFNKHQRIDRANASKIEEYFDSTKIRRALDEPSLLEGKGREGKGRDQGNVLFPEKPWEPTPMMKRINRWMRRRDTTQWSKKEIKALKAIGTPTEEDLSALERFYTAKIPTESDFRRRNIDTLLNNWTGEIDKANRYRPNTGF
jgi:hypothetical protein